MGSLSTGSVVENGLADVAKRLVQRVRESMNGCGLVITSNHHASSAVVTEIVNQGCSERIREVLGDCAVQG